MNDDLVERVAEAIARGVKFDDSGDDTDYEALARAAIAIIAPAVREECIRVAELWSRNGQSPTAHGIIDDIRAGASGDAP